MGLCSGGRGSDGGGYVMVSEREDTTRRKQWCNQRIELKLWKNKGSVIVILEI